MKATSSSPEKARRAARTGARRPRGIPIRPAAVAALVVAAELATALHAAAVSVSPVAVYLDDRTRTTAMTLYNPGDRAEEIRIEFGFGYPQNDAEGNVVVPVTDVAPEGEPSAAGWMRAFPQRIVLEPGQRQVVRIMARPPADLEDGEYWARALIRSRGGQAPIEQRSGEVGVQIEVETVVVVAVNFRHGDVRTGLRVDDARVVLGEASLQATVDLSREGNAAFLGRILVEALDASGRVVASGEEVLAVYHQLTRSVTVPLPGGVEIARVRYRMDTNRDDLPPGGPLPVDPVVHEVALP